MRFFTFSVACAGLLLSVAALPTPISDVDEPSLAERDVSISNPAVSVNETVALPNNFWEMVASVHNTRKSANGVTRRSTDSDGILVNKRIPVETPLLESYEDGVLEKRNSDDNCFIKCDTYPESPVGADILKAMDAIINHSRAWPDERNNMRLGGSTNNFRCSGVFPNQWEQGVGIEGTAKIGACGTADIQVSKGNLGSYFRQLVDKCSSNGRTGGYIECTKPGTEGWTRFMALNA